MEAYIDGGGGWLKLIAGVMAFMIGFVTFIGDAVVVYIINMQ